MTFDGKTYDAERDGPRLTGQLYRVRAAMLDGHWHSLSWLAGYTSASMPSVSARLRDLRKTKFGGYRIERRYLVAGLWEYRMLPPVPRVIGSDPLLVHDPLAISMKPIPGWRADAQK